MRINCILVSHDKEGQVDEAIISVLQQTKTDWRLFVIDSGVLLDKGYFNDYDDPRITFIKSNETAEQRQTKAMAPWCFNECFRRNLIELKDDELVVYLCDDDIFYENAFDSFCKWAERIPEVMAWYGSEDVAVNFPPGSITIVGERKALEISGQGAYRLDCRVDYLQLCHRASALTRFSDDEYWPEGKETDHHADGVFMEKLGCVTLIYPILAKIGQNRRCPNSTYNPLKTNGD